jgi:hypothetical protein
MHLANFNIARMRGPLDSPVMAEFMANLDHINRLGDSSPGFVWRLVDDGGVGSTAFRPYPDDDDMIVNLTVWESVEALRAFTYKSEHVTFLRRRREWFTHADGPYLALWWVPEGHIPSLEEAVERLAHLAEHGPTPYAFDFRSSFEPAAVAADPEPEPA